MRLMSVVVLSLGLMLSTSTLAAPPAADYLVTPGVSLGKIKLGMTKAEVRKTLGKPKDSFKLVEQKVDADVWRSKNVVQVFYKNDKVVQIAASSPSFQTSDNLSRASKADDINKRFQELEEVHTEGRQGVKAAYLDEKKSGLAFYYSVPMDSENDTTSWTSELIIVHKPNEKVLFQPDEEAYEPHPGE
ncbi:MAG TPA: hypothetical protein VK458_03770 [Myxococcaceae bacterium]|nr:hypothetical protein [Myxococcaceae bacterium]